jgi:hypothetical protein
MSNVRRRKNHMLYLQATQKARDALGIGKEPLNPPGQTTSALGNWMINIVPIGSRQAFLFMSARSLLSFPIMIGVKQPTLQDMPSFLSHGLKQLGPAMKVPSKKLSLLLQDFDEIAVCKATDKSLLGAFRAVAADYDHRVKTEGGVAKANIGAIISAVNSTPRQMLEYKNSFEVSNELLQGSDV